MALYKRSVSECSKSISISAHHLSCKAMVVQRLILCTVLVLYAVSTTGAQVCVEESVRLVDGGLYHGIVEVCVNNQWGMVCADNFGIEEAIVACRQLELGPPPNTDSSESHYCLFPKCITHLSLLQTSLQRFLYLELLWDRFQ